MTAQKTVWRLNNHLHKYLIDVKGWFGFSKRLEVEAASKTEALAKVPEIMLHKYGMGRNGIKEIKMIKKLKKE